MVIFQIVFSTDSHFQICSYSSFCQFKTRDDIPFLLVVMDKNLTGDDLSESGVNVDVPLRHANNEIEKSNKFGYVSYKKD